MSVLESINRKMQGGLGECAAITEVMPRGSRASYYTAHLYLWCTADDLTPIQVAGWFYEIGAVDVVVSAVLYDKDNNIINGSSVDDAVRPWDVSYSMPPRRPQYR